MLIGKLNREDYQKKTLQDVSKEFDSMISEYKQEISGMNVDQLKEEELRIVKIADEWDETLKTIEYPLAKYVTFRDANQTFSRKTIGEFINSILEKVECEFSYTLGYYELWEWWSKPKGTINYHTLNSTLSTLGTNIRYKGPQQWQKILVINEYFKALHNEYQIDNFFTILYGTCHSAVLDELNLKDPERSNHEDTTTHEVEAEQGPISVE